MSDVAEKELYVVVRRRYTDEEYGFSRWESVEYTDNEQQAVRIAHDTAKASGYLDIVTYVSAEFVSTISDSAKYIAVSKGDGNYVWRENINPKLSELENMSMGMRSYVKCCRTMRSVSVINIGLDMVAIFAGNLSEGSASLVSEALSFASKLYAAKFRTKKSDDVIYGFNNRLRDKIYDHASSSKSDIAIRLTMRTLDACLTGAHKKTCVANLLSAAYCVSNRHHQEIVRIINKYIPPPLVLIDFDNTWEW